MPKRPTIVRISIALAAARSGGTARCGHDEDRAQRVGLRAPADAVEFHRKYFKIFPEQLSWHEARMKCQDLGGHLAIATSDEENRSLTTLTRERGLDSPWLGATDEKVEGTWVCVDGTPMRYSHWDVAVKQPNDKQGLEHYVVLIVARDGMWSDQPDVSSQNHPGFSFEWDGQ